jgi:hypothetical protein
MLASYHHRRHHVQKQDHPQTPCTIEMSLSTMLLATTRA